MNIAVAGTGYVGLSLATLLSQHNHVMAVDIIPEKVDMVNHRKSPIQDEYIEEVSGREGSGSHGHHGRRGGVSGCGNRDYCHAYQL